MCQQLPSVHHSLFAADELNQTPLHSKTEAPGGRHPPGASSLQGHPFRPSSEENGMPTHGPAIPFPD
jgi:hypothetical protein